MTAFLGFFSRDKPTGPNQGTRSLMAGVMARVMVCALTVLVAGCGSLSLTNTSPKVDYFVLRDLALPAAPTAGTPPRNSRVLLIAGSTSQSLFDSERMVFTKDGISRSYYQFANWSDRPASSVAGLAETRLSRVGGFKTVAQSTSALRTDLLLSLRLNELTHDDSISPGVVRLDVTADLLDWRTRELIARRTFTQKVEVDSRDSIGGAQAANRAVTTMLDELSLWVETSTKTLK
jgi:cholesterol transport system auxiliary component